METFTKLFGRHSYGARCIKFGSVLTGRIPRRNALPRRVLGCDDHLPCLESTLPFELVVRSRKEMSFRSEVSGHDIVHFEKTLRMPRRFEALHPALSLPGRLMGVLCSIVEVPALPMSDSQQDYLLGYAVTTKLVCNDHARPAATALQQLPKEPHSSKSISLGLHQNIDDGTLLIDGTPEVMLHSVDLEKDFVQKPITPIAADWHSIRITFTGVTVPIHRFKVSRLLTDPRE